MHVRQPTRRRGGRGIEPVCRRTGGVQRWRRGPAWVILLGALGSLAIPTPSIAQSAGSPAADQALQLAQPTEPGQASPHLTITLHDALDRAEKNDAEYNAAVTDSRLAREDRIQARAAGLPAVNLETQALLTQGNGKIPTGRYVTNDGVHVYRQWGVLHQDFSPGTLTMLGARRGAALEAQAQARAEIAQRGLKVTVTEDYYSLVVSERKFATAQESLGQAQRFLDMTQKQEQQGEVAHSDVVKAQIQYNQQYAALEDAQLQMESDRLALAVVIFPTLTENFSVVDDLDEAQSLPAFSEVQAMAARGNPELRAAMEAVRASNLDVSAARLAMLPSLSADVNYGIEANRYALRSVAAEYPEDGTVPNLGYFATLTLNLPVWDWGSLRSKLRQSEYRREQARIDLTAAQRAALSKLYSFYNEAYTTRRTVDTLRQTADLASESLRLTTLRYQAGQALALEVVDAQTTLAQARNAYDDAQVHLRVALAELETVTGNF